VVAPFGGSSPVGQERPAVRQRRLIRYRVPRSEPAAGPRPSAELMKARAAAINALLCREREDRQAQPVVRISVTCFLDSR
jgi:hypothetical protein